LPREERSAVVPKTPNVAAVSIDPTVGIRLAFVNQAALRGYYFSTIGRRMRQIA
jgi:hypothetical protein